MFQWIFIHFPQGLFDSVGGNWIGLVWSSP